MLDGHVHARQQQARSACCWPRSASTSLSHNASWYGGSGGAAALLPLPAASLWQLLLLLQSWKSSRLAGSPGSSWSTGAGAGAGSARCCGCRVDGGLPSAAAAAVWGMPALLLHLRCDWHAVAAALRLSSASCVSGRRVGAAADELKELARVRQLSVAGHGSKEGSRAAACWHHGVGHVLWAVWSQTCHLFVLAAAAAPSRLPASAASAIQALQHPRTSIRLPSIWTRSAGAANRWCARHCSHSLPSSSFCALGRQAAQQHGSGLLQGARRTGLRSPTPAGQRQGSHGGGSSCSSGARCCCSCALTLGAMSSSNLAEVKLWSNSKEREKYENLADLYAILKCTEKLERAYVRDGVSAKEYEGACEKLIAQFKMLSGSMRETVPSIEGFMGQYHMQCPMAYTRLVQVGLPATIEHRKRPGEAGGGGARAVAETVQHFITAMDSLKLNLVAVDQVCPILSDLTGAMSRIESLPPDFGPKGKAKAWYSRLYAQPASYELSQDEVRQLLFDLESAYNEFIATIR